MAEGWDGATPVAQDDGATSYELGQAWTANGDLTVTAVRVWHGPTSASVLNRSARVWTTGGVQLAEVLLDDALPAGWTTFELAAPLEVEAGTSLVLSYSTFRYYGATPGGYPNDSADGLVTYTSGLFTETAVPVRPTTASASFYGVDLVYEAGIGGNTAPVATLVATVAGRTVTATATVEDETPGSLTYRWEFGDGTTVPNGTAVEEHTYAADGIYAVLLVVTDAGGLRDSAAVPVVARAGTPGGMDVEAVVRELATRLDTVAGLQVHLGPPRKVKVPAAVVAYPRTINYDKTYGRGSDSMVVPVVALVSRLNDDSALSSLSAFSSGFGSRSVKQVLESGEYVTFDDLQVPDAEFDVWTMAGVEYLAAVFSVTVMG